MTEGEVEGEKENKGSQGTPALRNTKNETPLFPFLSHRKREPKQGVIGLVLVNADGGIVRETGDVRARDEKSKEEKSRRPFVFDFSVTTLVLLTLFSFSTIPYQTNQHDACARAGQAGIALASLGRAMVRDVDPTVSPFEVKENKERDDEKKTLTF